MKDFEKDLSDLINAHSLENASDTPDFILAEYLVACLEAFNHSAKDQATADYAAMTEAAFITACFKRTAWASPA